jgi:hypothetical protein
MASQLSAGMSLGRASASASFSSTSSSSPLMLTCDGMNRAQKADAWCTVFCGKQNHQSVKARRNSHCARWISSSSSSLPGMHQQPHHDATLPRRPPSSPPHLPGCCRGKRCPGCKLAPASGRTWCCRWHQAWPGARWRPHQDQGLPAPAARAPARSSGSIAPQIIVGAELLYCQPHPT